VLWYSEPSGPPEYRLGWQDGCDTGLSQEDSGYIYRAIYGYKKRPEMADNDLYKSGWADGNSYCRATESSQQKGKIF
jgi:hypothetical protein